jgi:hypothetical protein
VLAVQPENRLFRDMLLSNDTVQRKIQELCIFIRKEIVHYANKGPFFSLCLDESNDVTKTAQIIVCVRYFDVDENLSRETFVPYLFNRTSKCQKYLHCSEKRLGFS